MRTGDFKQTYGELVTLVDSPPVWLWSAVLVMAWVSVAAAWLHTAAASLGSIWPATADSPCARGGNASGVAVVMAWVSEAAGYGRYFVRDTALRTRHALIQCSRWPSRRSAPAIARPP